MSECELRVRMEIKAAQFWASASAGCFLRAGLVLPVKAVVEFWRSASLPKVQGAARYRQGGFHGNGPSSEEPSPSHQQPSRAPPSCTPLSVSPTEIIRWDCICLCARKADPAQPAQSPSLQSN